MWGWLGPVPGVPRADHASEAEQMGSTAQAAGATERVATADKADAAGWAQADATDRAQTDESTSTGVRDFDVALSERVPALRDSLVSVAVCMALALCLNDSGIVLPGMAAIMVVPLLEVLVLRFVDVRERSARVHAFGGGNRAGEDGLFAGAEGIPASSSRADSYEPPVRK